MLVRVQPVLLASLEVVVANPVKFVSRVQVWEARQVRADAPLPIHRRSTNVISLQCKLDGTPHEHASDNSAAGPGDWIVTIPGADGASFAMSDHAFSSIYYPEPTDARPRSAPSLARPVTAPPHPRPTTLPGGLPAAKEST